MNKGYVMDLEKIKAIELILNKGNRVELIPVKGDIKVMQISRSEVKPKNK